jgi:hypothetical protein
MGDRYWLWVGARLLVGVVIVMWAVSYLGAGSGEKEFRKVLEALKQVHTFRMTYTANPTGTQHSEMLWEVDCNRDALHHQWHLVESSTNPPSELNQDNLVVAGQEYARQTDGSWSPARSSGFGSAKIYCHHLADGTDGRLMPQIATMIQRGIIQKGDKKTVNGIRCREWLVTLKGGTSGLEHDTVCLGLEDHLPYEMTVDWAHSRSIFSDYNAPIQLDLPEAAMQPASSNSGSN